MWPLLDTGKQAGIETVQLYVRERFTPMVTRVSNFADSRESRSKKL